MLTPCKNAERLQVQRTSVVDFELDLFNKHVRCVRHHTVPWLIDALYYVFKATSPFNDTSVKKRL